MVILASNGLSSDKIINEFKKVLHDSDKKAAIVTTASWDVKENATCVPIIKDIYKIMGIETTCVDIETEDSKELLKYDIVEIIGGNPFYLMKVIDNTNFKEVINKMLQQDKIIIGWSAGAFVFQESMKLSYDFTPEMNDDKVKLKDLSGMNIVDFEIMPHCQWFVTQFDNFEDRIKEYEKEYNKTVYRLNDGEAIFVYDDQITLISYKPMN